MLRLGPGQGRPGSQARRDGRRSPGLPPGLPGWTAGMRRLGPNRAPLGPVKEDKISKFSSVFGRFSDKVGPRSLPNGLPLPSFRIGHKNYNLYVGFWPVSGRTWPRDPFQRVGLEKWCRNHPQLTSKNVGAPPLLLTRAKRSKSGSFGNDPTST